MRGSGAGWEIFRVRPASAGGGVHQIETNLRRARRRCNKAKPVCRPRQISNTKSEDEGADGWASRPCRGSEHSKTFRVGYTFVQPMRHARGGQAARPPEIVERAGGAALFFSRQSRPIARAKAAFPRLRDRTPKDAACLKTLRVGGGVCRDRTGLGSSGRMTSAVANVRRRQT